MRNLKLLTMAVLIAFATGCDKRTEVKGDTLAGIPGPIYPSDTVMDKLYQSFGEEPESVVWVYLHDDLQNKCALERALGKECKWLDKDAPIPQ